ncbi:hypothetical protein E3C22_06000 [Jiella endophytica]|uniref:Lytic murein transglycosylase n=1 Tax=Jiella endophytica TaxID=2558362 RepID=A0A4Y8RNM8_9HYPH|nr:hypothetical protein E3C22_06000 [Jiella endophytica]
MAEILLPALLTPLCPAGHLPLKGGDRTPTAGSANLCRLHVGQTHNGKRVTSTLLISPLEGKMSGRTEGGKPPQRLTNARFFAAGTLRP